MCVCVCVCVCVYGRGAGGTGSMCSPGEGRGQVSGDLSQRSRRHLAKDKDGDHDVLLFNWRKMSVFGENLDTVSDDLCVYFTGKIRLRKNC